MLNLIGIVADIPKKVAFRVNAALERAEVKRINAEKEKIRNVEIAEAEEAYMWVAVRCPGDFEALGLRLKSGNLKASHYFDDCDIEYEAVRRVWNRMHPDPKDQLPEYSSKPAYSEKR